MNITAPTRIRTASELKAYVEENGHEPHFFTRSTMKFFGDTMRNYRVSGPYNIETHSGPVEVYGLHRRRAVKHGLMSSTFFATEDFRRVFPVTD